MVRVMNERPSKFAAAASLVSVLALIVFVGLVAWILIGTGIAGWFF